MAIKFNIEPYWDDFNIPTAVDGLTPREKYNRILFRPGHALQARELTQMQSILQNQVSSMGDHMFKEGSIVVPGHVHIHNKIDYIKASDTVTNLDDYIGVSLELGTSIFKVVHVEAATENDAVTLFGNYMSGDVFTDGSSVVDADTGISLTVNTVGHGSIISVDEGIYYIKKNFVIVKSSTIVLAKYDTDVSYDVGLRVQEEVVSAGSDVSLNDNALGTPNEAAPGAHRYSITTELVKREVNSAIGNFVLLARLQSGKITKHARSTDYAVIEDTLARRTFDESGNYTVNPFPASVKNHVSPNPDATKLTLGIEPSKAYVRGYEIETLSTTDVEFDKARDADLATDKVTTLDINNFIDVSSIVGLPDITTFEPITLLDDNGNVKGEARVRSIQYIADGSYRLHVFDLSGSISQATNVKDSASLGDTTPKFTANLIAGHYNLANDSLVFALPYSRIKTCNAQTDVLLPQDFNYSYNCNKEFTPVAVASHQVNFSCNVESETFSQFDTTNWILKNDSTGDIIHWDTVYSYIDDEVSGNVNTNPITVTINNNITPPQVTINFLPQTVETKYTTLIAPVNRTLKHKQKSLIPNHGMVFSYSTAIDFNTYQQLPHCDIQSIVSITEGGQDITKHFDFDNGQRDTHYAPASIKLKVDTNFTVTGDLDVTYNYFDHGTGDFFTIDSYTGQVDYEGIPSHNGIELRSAVDFRPRMNNSGGHFTGSGASVTTCPRPNTQFTTDIQYYLNRIDKVYLDKDGEFGVLKGVSDLDPSEPGMPKDAMVLYHLNIPAYTMTPNEVDIQYIDNKRYTMRDIGKLENRINKLEYYTVLSLLEKEASDKQILGAGNIDKFKTGFLVDSFQSTNVARTDSTEYSVGIDRANGLLRPLFSENNVSMLFDNSSSAQRTGDLVTLPYTNTAIIEQLQYSTAINVNPYDVFNWSGSLKLTPETDEWKDIDRRPNVIINNDGVFDAMSAIVNEAVATGTVWNSWQTNWTGTTTVASGRRRDQTTTRGQSRAGSVTSIGTDTVSTTVGDRVVSVNFAPFMRSRFVSFEGTRLRPNTEVFAFFDGVEVSSYVNTVDMDILSAAFAVIANNALTTGINDKTAHPLGATSLVTDANGFIKGSFWVPNNSDMSFNTGDKTFLLTSSENNNPNDNNITFASANYAAKGLIETKENVSISTRVPTIQREAVNQTRTNESTRTYWVDPLAQSIMVDLQGGAFVTSLDLFFQSKDANIPVEIQIREMDQGIPTQRVVPLSRKTLNPVDVIIPDVVNTNPATTFTFDSPVYLQDGIEYCFVIMANSNQYNVKVAEIGQDDVDGNRINKQPYNGVMFKSANASTWTPDQNTDISFRMNRAVFSSSASIDLYNDSIQARSLELDPFQTIIGSKDIIVSHRNHGMTNGESVVIDYAGTSNINGIPLVEVKSSHTIKNVERDRYTVTTPTASTGTGIDGGAGVTASENLAWNTIFPFIQEITLPNTGMTWGIKDTMLQGENDYVIGSSYTPIIINNNYTPQVPRAILNTTDPTLEFRGTLTSDNDNVSPVIDMQRCSAITVFNRINNPIGVDTNGFNTVSNFFEETDAYRGSSLSKYVTKTVQLDESSDELKVFLDVNRPSKTGIELYFKTSSEATGFDNLPWEHVTATIGSIPYSDDPSYYREMEYSVSVEPFTLFAIKIVFTSQDTSKIPSCKSLRSIALLS